mmetsp:Transcript_19342/g.36321  ORF Transcript_19342/g.36321 Transcript_19342/m.36321 type:complete len:310 (-) Transcript_19342:330-1259(-)
MVLPVDKEADAVGNAFLDALAAPTLFRTAAEPESLIPVLVMHVDSLPHHVAALVASADVHLPGAVVARHRGGEGRHLRWGAQGHLVDAGALRGLLQRRRGRYQVVWLLVTSSVAPLVQDAPAPHRGRELAGPLGILPVFVHAHGLGAPVVLIPRHPGVLDDVELEERLPVRTARRQARPWLNAMGDVLRGPEVLVGRGQDLLNLGASCRRGVLRLLIESVLVHAGRVHHAGVVALIDARVDGRIHVVGIEGVHEALDPLRGTILVLERLKSDAAGPDHLGVVHPARFFTNSQRGAGLVRPAVHVAGSLL